LLSLIVVALGCSRREGGSQGNKGGSGPRPKPALPEAPHRVVSALYLVPRDRAVNPAFPGAIAHALAATRDWYWHQMADEAGASRTFAIDPAGVRVVTTGKPSSAYSLPRTDGSAKDDAFYFNVAEEAKAAVVGLGAGAHAWIVFIDADPTCGLVETAANLGLAVIPSQRMHGLAGEAPPPICPHGHRDWTMCDYIGTVAHEGGHALGLKHPDDCPTLRCGEPDRARCPRNPGCDHVLMYLGRNLSDRRVGLLEEDRAVLRSSPFLYPTRASGLPPVVCSSLR